MAVPRVAIAVVALLCATGALFHVQCRSYNNGLIFYDLITHVPYLPPTVSVSRGRELASIKYSTKGSIWSTFGKPCECSGVTCGCCAGITVKQYNFDQKMCANVTYRPGQEEALLDVSLNEHPSAKYGISTRNPSPFCIPVMMGIPMAMCVQMSDIAIQGNNLNMCMDFIVRLATTDLFEMHFQCMKMGIDGLQYVDKNGQPVIPPSGAKTPLASEQSYDEYYDETTDSEIQINDSGNDNSYNALGENENEDDVAVADADADAESGAEEVYGDVESDGGTVAAIAAEPATAVAEENAVKEMIAEPLRQPTLQHQQLHQQYELETESELSTTTIATPTIELEMVVEAEAGVDKETEAALQADAKIESVAITANVFDGNNVADGDNDGDDTATTSYGVHNDVIDAITQTSSAAQPIVVANITTSSVLVLDDAAIVAAATAQPAAAAADDTGYGHGASISLNLDGNAVDDDDAAAAATAAIHIDHTEEKSEAPADSLDAADSDNSLSVSDTDRDSAVDIDDGENVDNHATAMTFNNTKNTGTQLDGEQQQPQKLPTVTEVVNVVAETMAEVVAEAVAEVEANVNSEAAADASDSDAKLTASDSIPPPPSAPAAQAAQAAPAAQAAQAAQAATASASPQSESVAVDDVAAAAAAVPLAADLITFYRRSYG